MKGTLPTSEGNSAFSLLFPYAKELQYNFLLNEKSVMNFSLLSVVVTYGNCRKLQRLVISTVTTSLHQYDLLHVVTVDVTSRCKLQHVASTVMTCYIIVICCYCRGIESL